LKDKAKMTTTKVKDKQHLFIEMPCTSSHQYISIPYWRRMLYIL